MRKFLLAAVTLTAVPSFASAVTIDDPLHGVVCSGAGTGCTNAGDNGSFTPLASVTNWGFVISPGPKTGTLELVIGVPTDEINPATYTLPTLTDTTGGVAVTVFDRVTFFNANSPNNALLTSYLGLSSFSPPNNFSNLSAGTAANDPTFGGNFLVFTVTMTGTQAPNRNVLLSSVAGCDTTPPGCSIADDFSFASNIPGGSFITGLFVTTDNQGNPDNVGTAASAHLVTYVPGPIAGAGIPGVIGACIGLVGLARRRQRQVAQYV
jgi:hypothetical protein